MRPRCSPFVWVRVLRGRNHNRATGPDRLFPLLFLVLPLPLAPKGRSTACPRSRRVVCILKPPPREGPGGKGGSSGPAPRSSRGRGGRARGARPAARRDRERSRRQQG